MPRYVLTGAPGSGKTAMLRLLESAGFAVVEEAVTDVIALEQARGRPEPWTSPGFIDEIVKLQRQRQFRAGPHAQAAFFDRSPVCTLALSRFLGWQPSRQLATELGRIARDAVYEPVAFFVRNQGFVTPTAARRISFAQSLAFEHVHEQAYREFGFRLVDVPAGALADRVALVLREISGLARLNSGDKSVNDLKGEQPDGRTGGSGCAGARG
jgi:predicted ATPase